MSSSVSSPAGSNTSSISGDSHYDNPGDFNLAKGIGPANRVPDQYKSLILKDTLCVQWLGVNPRSKNHMVYVVEFENPFFDADWNKLVYSARISMELSPTNFNALTGSTWVPGQDYHPGEFTIKLLPYATMNPRTKMCRTFPLSAGITLADINNFVYGRNMHKFVFLSYYGDQWKGCGDFILQLWGELVRNGLVGPQSREAPESEFCLDLMTTVLPNNTEVSAPIGRGFWIGWNPKDDTFTPAHIYDDAQPDPPHSLDV